MSRTAVRIFFNFRSPYCYLASHTLFARLAAFDVDIQWRSLGGWDGRSAPERAKVKVPLTRQDVARWCRRMGVPFNPPPVSTDPTPAALVAFAAEEAGLLPRYVERVMWREWAEGQDIGMTPVLEGVAEDIGLGADAVRRALDDFTHLARLQENWQEATSLGVIGVPTFVVGDQIFWGNDRLEFLEEHLTELGLGKR
ncbi:MAG: 2-hydroxychromene-2-carboxylate isomerase [Proteobacteria bacterium]|nr:2-hydroxychromene-2-carboxylate isomerase [Pseudomonadota bacterium]MBK8960196.1 2-hydroxychromene-2-carboxylate isomerase [Pseudomonadota bacterium]